MESAQDPARFLWGSRQVEGLSLSPLLVAGVTGCGRGRSARQVDSYLRPVLTDRVRSFCGTCNAVAEGASCRSPQLVLWSMIPFAPFALATELSSYWG